ncbi:MAG: alkaline phosphatase [Desulfamplus sp.]|nr:alkaline phosphatase [Desulfamplus sp.]
MNRNSKTNRWIILFLSLTLFNLMVCNLYADSYYKNVIILMTDGTGSTHTTLTRWYKGSNMALDEMNVGAVRTYGSNSIITDSAPAATAFATGHKSEDKFVGVLPSKTTIPGLEQIAEDLKYKPVATVLEGARVLGRSTGLVATSNIQHASPAAYSSHWHARSNYTEIAEQQVYQNIDVVFGAGKKYLLPESEGGARKDGENLISVLKSNGYSFVETRDEMLNLNNVSKVWGMFADDAMAYEFDRPTLKPNEPSLEEMTQKAIEILSKNQNGFFLFVEASKVDWASHPNDPIGVISDVLAFDAAAKVALDFAKKDQNTLILAFSDHGNGGMSIGSKKSDDTYSSTPVESLIAPLKKASLTGEGLEAMIAGDLTEDNIKAKVAQYYGIEDLTAEEIEAIKNHKKGSLNSVVGPMISNRSLIGWTTNGHTGEDLFFYYYGLNSALRVIENSDIALGTALFMGFSLDGVDKRLFVESEELFKPIGASVSIDKSDANNMCLVVNKGSKTAKIPFAKNIMEIGDSKCEMEGVTVYAEKTGKVYLPSQALTLFENSCN